MLRRKVRDCVKGKSKAPIQGPGPCNAASNASSDRIRSSRSKIRRSPSRWQTATQIGFRPEGALVKSTPRTCTSPSDHPFQHQPPDIHDRLGRVQPLRADLGAVHDRVAAIELERILKVVEPLARRLVAAV